MYNHSFIRCCFVCRTGCNNSTRQLRITFSVIHVSPSFESDFPSGWCDGPVLLDVCSREHAPLAITRAFEPVGVDLSYICDSISRVEVELAIVLCNKIIKRLHNSPFWLRLSPWWRSWSRPRCGRCGSCRCRRLPATSSCTAAAAVEAAVFVHGSYSTNQSLVQLARR